MGLKHLYAKHEGMNPSGSFKDRGMTVGVTMALQLSKKSVACASTGNTSASLAVYAAKAGIPAVVLLPAGKVVTLLDISNQLAEQVQYRGGAPIAGGGPAGMMLGWLLARAGVTVVVLEKHRDFLRDFRGDTIHPSTLEVLHELGVLSEFLKRPHREIREITGRVGRETLTLGDFSHLPTRCKFIAMMPQWDFLDFLAEQGRRYPNFHLKMQAEVTSLIENAGRIAGVQAVTPNGTMEVRADLVVGADGRSSVVRRLSGLRINDVGAPMDVLWLRLSKRPNDPQLTLRFERGKVLVTLSRDGYWQCGLLIPKGSAEKIRQQGIDALRVSITDIAPFLKDRTGEIRDWNEIKLLTVKIDRLQE